MSKLFKLLCSGIGAAAFTFLLQILLSHKLLINQFGIYAAANSSLTMIGPFAGMGIGGLLLRKTCIDESRTHEYFSVALKCLVLNILFAIIISQYVLCNTGLSVIETLCMSSYYLPIAFQYLVVSQAQSSENFIRVSLAQIINPLLRVLLVLFLFLLLPSLKNTVILLCVANTISFFFLMQLIDRKFSFKLLFLKQSKSFFFSFYRESFFYSFNGTINVIQIQFSIIMAMYFFGSNCSGLYSSAIILLTASYILPNTIFGTYLLPKYHKLEKEILKAKSLRHGILAFVFGLVFFSFIGLSSDTIIKLIYPDSFKYSARLLNILAVSLPFRFYSTAIGAALLNEKCIRYKVLASFISLVFQIAFMFFLQKLGEESISISFVFSEVLTSILYTLIFFKYFQNKNIK
ncbi:oligosaccharide flippase family protein [uncultured Flavobacterium sp.]|uniref:oligosaccharide flippase family protein n=1 Tax=uncultured Flavobacterium sp. TaxID=165435 RepID=UPI002930D652|nr:oligosaccharide flippase family protein [uncultured Flavobacterium sp.]